jgi:hypothetical protein
MKGIPVILGIRWVLRGEPSEKGKGSLPESQSAVFERHSLPDPAFNGLIASQESLMSPTT